MARYALLLLPNRHQTDIHNVVTVEFAEGLRNLGPTIADASPKIGRCFTNIDVRCRKDTNPGLKFACLFRVFIQRGWWRLEVELDHR